MAFTFSPYVSPYVESISNLMQKPAEAQAEAARNIGAAQANAAVQSGAAWGQAAQGIGQGIGNTVQQYNDPRIQLARQEFQANQRSMQYQTTATKIAQSLVGPNGEQPSVDAAQTMLTKAGIPVTFQKPILDSLDSMANHHKEGTADAGNLTYRLLSALPENATPEDRAHAAAAGLGAAMASGFVTPASAKQITDALAQGADPKSLALSAMALSPTGRFKDVIQDETKSIVVPGAPRPGAGPSEVFSGGKVVATGAPSAGAPPTSASIALDAATLGTQNETPTAAASAKAMELEHPKPVEAAQHQSVLLDNKPAIVQFEPKSKQWLTASGQPIDNADARIKPIPPASMTINPALVPSGDALDMAAKKYLATGDLPSMGMGQAGAAARVAVMNRAAAIDPQAGLAANKATYQADSANLKKLQTTEGTLSAFEKTAGKNLDQFLSLADKIPDTGVPWLNQPIRAVNANGLGSADQAAFNAARDVALREIARVTNDPKLSGALTDSARAEVAGLSPASATFAQIRNVAKVLKQDMANVHAGVNEQIATVKSGLQGHPGSTVAPSAVEQWERGTDGKLHRKSD